MMRDPPGVNGQWQQTCSMICISEVEGMTFAKREGGSQPALAPWLGSEFGLLAARKTAASGKGRPRGRVAPSLFSAVLTKAFTSSKY